MLRINAARCLTMRILSYPDLREKGIKKSRTQIWRMVRDGKFPKPFKFGSTNCWTEPEIDKLIEKLAAERDQATA